MTIQIPDDLARGLEGIAAAQHKSVEQVALESLRSLFDRALDTNAISDLMRASPRIENWMARLAQTDRVVTCTVVRGEILFRIARIPPGRRRSELEEASSQFLTAIRCEPIPERAGDFYAPFNLRGNSAFLR
jgi:predicted transcriptional regulator